MKFTISTFLGCLVIFSLPLQAQSDSARARPDWAKLEQELNLALSGNNKNNIVNSKNSIINTGITVMEP
jgi:hypothetical protein